MEYLNNDLCVPIWKKGIEFPLSTKEIGLILINNAVPVNKVCSSTPLYVNKNACFIVDTSNFSDWRDVKQDLLPGLVKNMTEKHYFRYEDEDLSASDK